VFSVSASGRNVMLGAYILIQAEAGTAEQVAGQVAAVPGVIGTVGVTGPYDVIARAEAADADEMGDLVVAAIQRIEGITHTLTCPIVNRGAG
jgi:DNA-binding Lrp family transcriptional regulator